MQWKCRDEEEALIKPKPKAASRGALNKNDNRALKGAQKQFSISKNVFSLSLSLSLCAFSLRKPACARSALIESRVIFTFFRMWINATARVYIATFHARTQLHAHLDGVGA